MHNRSKPGILRITNNTPFLLGIIADHAKNINSNSSCLIAGPLHALILNNSTHHIMPALFQSYAGNIIVEAILQNQNILEEKLGSIGAAAALRNGYDQLYAGKQTLLALITDQLLHPGLMRFYAETNDRSYFLETNKQE
jgi:hypothetical protein